MNGLRNSWILVGIFLWGLPTGLALCILLAYVAFDGGLHVVNFRAALFNKNCLIILPIFCVNGIILGYTLGKMCERVKRH